MCGGLKSLDVVDGLGPVRLKLDYRSSIVHVDWRTVFCAARSGNVDPKIGWKI